MSEIGTIGGLLPVSALVSDGFARVSPGATLHEVAQALVAGDVGALVVGDGEDVDGVISERDLVRALASDEDIEPRKAIDLASTTIVWADASAPVVEVATLMMDRYVRHVLLEQDGRVLGLVSARDLLGAFAAADEGLALD